MRLGFCFKPLRFYSTEPDSTVGFGIRRRHDFLSTVEEGLLGTPVGSQADSFPERISELETIKADLLKAIQGELLSFTPGPRWLV